MHVRVSEEVAQALQEGRPVVALDAISTECGNSIESGRNRTK